MNFLTFDALNEKYYDYYIKSISITYNINLFKIDMEYLNKKIKTLNDIKVNALKTIVKYKSDKRIKTPLDNYLLTLNETLNKYHTALKNIEESHKKLNEELIEYNEYMQIISDLIGK